MVHLVIVALFYTAARTGLITVISLSPQPAILFNWGDSNETFAIINLSGTRGNPHEGVHILEQGNGCNHLSASVATPFIKGPDVVFVVDAAVVFTQFPQNHLREKKIFDVSKGNGSELYIQIRRS